MCPVYLDPKIEYISKKMEERLGFRMCKNQVISYVIKSIKTLPLAFNPSLNPRYRHHVKLNFVKVNTATKKKFDLLANTLILQNKADLVVALITYYIELLDNTICNSRSRLTSNHRRLELTSSPPKHGQLE